MKTRCVGPVVCMVMIFCAGGQLYAAQSPQSEVDSQQASVSFVPAARRGEAEAGSWAVRTQQRFVIVFDAYRLVYVNFDGRERVILWRDGDDDPLHTHTGPLTGLPAGWPETLRDSMPCHLDVKQHKNGQVTMRFVGKESSEHNKEHE